MESICTALICEGLAHCDYYGIRTSEVPSTALITGVTQDMQVIVMWLCTIECEAVDLEQHVYQLICGNFPPSLATSLF